MKMNNKALTMALSAVAMLVSSSVFAAEEVEVGQKNKAFTMKEVNIKVGDSVKFTNEDPFFHNVYSLSDASTFDLGSYPKGKFKIIKFETAGQVEVECAIHPDMRMIVNVE